MPTLHPASEGYKFIERFANFTHVGMADLLDEVTRYNKDFAGYGEEIYERLGTRVAHWANYLDQDWFQRRLDLPLLRADEFDVVLDLGFSSPYALSRPSLRGAKGPHFLYVDRQPSCLQFYETLLAIETWGDSSTRATVLTLDVEESASQNLLIQKLEQLRPHSVLVVASEILEHLSNPDRVMQWILAHLGAGAYERAALYVTLPVGKRIPSHRAEFLKPEVASSWVSRFVPNPQGFLLSPEGVATSPYLASAYCMWAELLGNPRPKAR